MIDTNQTRSAFQAELAKASTEDSVSALKVKYLGRKQGILTLAFAELAQLSFEEKRKQGPALNQLRQEVETALKAREEKLEESQSEQKVDFTLPPLERPRGHLHPLTIVQHELVEIFRRLGFTETHGPEIESDWYNFTSLNIPKDHPARDVQDTFYVDQKLPKGSKGDSVVLRTHISNMQVRFMEQHKPPFSVIAPGIVYRNEATDITHEHTYQYLEGMVVGDTITFANMVWTLNYVLRSFFGDDVKTKLVPSYFPFVEPGAEVALSSPRFHNGKWVEILGCGMVHQNVFEAAGYPKGRYQGFAFGFGMTRFAAMKYGIPDIRMFAENDMRVLEQF